MHFDKVLSASFVSFRIAIISISSANFETCSFVSEKATSSFTLLCFPGSLLPKFGIVYKSVSFL